MADATGHGAGAAMVTSIFTGLYKGLKALSSFKNCDQEAGGLIEDISNQIHEICHDKYWLALGILWFDPKPQTFRYYSAGATPVMIQTNGKISAKFGRGNSRPLGGATAGWGVTSGPFVPGSRAFIFTDGISEMKNDNDRQIGFRGIRSILYECSELGTEGAVRHFFKEIGRIKSGRPLDDDQTSVLIDFKKKDTEA